MKKFLLAAALLLAASLSAKAQTTLQVTDAGSQSWNNGTWSVQLVVGGNIQYGGQFYVGTTVVPNQVQSGSLSNTGSATIFLTPNNTITPVPTLWNYTVCPNANAVCFTQGVNITASNQAVTLTPPIPQVTAANSGVTKAYSDAEIVNALPGAQYYNIVSNQQRICNGPSPCTWAVAGGGLVPSSPGIAADIRHVTVSPNCLTGSPNCFAVADDTQLVNNATWSAGANVQVTLNASGPHFQCPGGVYPCSGGTSSPTNDNGKSAQAGANCRAINPGQCDTSIPAGTIISIQSATVATLSSTAATASSTGSGNSFFAWGTDDTSQLSAANDYCLVNAAVRTGCTLDLPCGRMWYSASSFTSIRVSRSSNLNRPYFIDGHHCAELIVAQNFSFTDPNGAFLDLPVGAGQNPGGDGWSDGAEGITFFTFFDVPASTSQFGAGFNAFVNVAAYAIARDVWVVGAFWNITLAKTVYGFACNRSDLCSNDVSWSSGNRALYAAGAIQGTTTVEAGYYGQSITHSCDIDGANVVFLSGTQCQWSLSSNASENGASLDTLSTFTGELWTMGANIQGTYWMNGGTSHINDFHFNTGGAGQGFHVQNAAAKVYIHQWHYGPNGAPWLTLSAGFVHLGCGNSPWTSGFTGANAATITGGTFQVDSCSVGGDNQAAQVAAISAKTLFTVGAGTALFRVHLSVECTTTSAGATVTPSILYTDTSNTSQTVTGTAANCAALGAASNTSQDVTFRAKNATNIQYQTTIANTPTYDVSVSVEQLSLD